MHAVYLFRHSAHGDEEIRCSIRSLRRNMKFVDKVWIFGDRPLWLADDQDDIEHLPHEELAWIRGYRTPVVNAFVMHFLVALMPEVSPEFVVMADDYVVLKEFSLAEARKVRFLEDLSTVQNRGRGVWKSTLWRTYDVLKRLRCSGLNFESHVPVIVSKRQILNAFQALEDFVSQDRYFGVLARTAIFNHALKSQTLDLIQRDAEGTFVGLYLREHTDAEIIAACEGKTLLNFDDAAFNDAMRMFLREKFPEPVPGEKTDDLRHSP